MTRDPLLTRLANRSAECPANGDVAVAREELDALLAYARVANEIADHYDGPRLHLVTVSNIEQQSVDGIGATLEDAWRDLECHLGTAPPRGRED